MRFHLLFGLHVVAIGFTTQHAEQWRLGEVDVATRDQVVHLTVEEAEQQGADVRAVDIGIRHDNDLVVTPLGDVLVEADTAADRLDHALDFLVGQDFVLSALVGVNDLTTQRQDGLKITIATAFSTSAGRISFH